MKKTEYDVSIVLPVYNEEKRIKYTVDRIVEYFISRNLNYEIIVVDDGSRDKTLDIVKEVCEGRSENLHFLHNHVNMGKGFSVKRGIMFARGDIILFSDADLSTPIEEYEKLEKALKEGEYDAAIASRAMPDSIKTVPQGFFRDRMGKLFGKIVQILVLPDIEDSQCGFKAFKKECAHFVFYWQTIFGFGFDPEILYLCKKHGYKVKQIPVKWENSFDSKLNPFTDTLKIGFELFKIRLKILLGHYDV
ncbi:MAG: glycosyltransferase family 2 protein [Endomicrobiales bacterium]|nr:glycosyltransferase family 2 protein [Endomicrobiales bacterium]